MELFLDHIHDLIDTINGIILGSYVQLAWGFSFLLNKYLHKCGMTIIQKNHEIEEYYGIHSYRL